MKFKNNHFKKRFSDQDQSNFSKISGDYNPLHINKRIARRLIFGSTVVHGINLLLCALNTWIFKKKINIEIGSLDVEFIKPVNVEQNVVFKYTSLKNNNEIIELTVGEVLTTKINFNKLKSLHQILYFKIQMLQFYVN